MCEHEVAEQCSSFGGTRNLLSDDGPADEPRPTNLSGNYPTILKPSTSRRKARLAFDVCEVSPDQGAWVTLFQIA
jgi:hypothetical protein